MKKRIKLFFIVLFLILDVFLWIGYITIRDATMLNELKKEVLILSDLSMTKDRYNRRIHTTGNYAIVEKTMKTYLDDTAILLQESILITKDERLTKILSYENYEKDGPLFQESFTYLTNEKEVFLSNMDTLLERLEDPSVQKYGKEQIKDPYYRKLYLEFLLNDDMRDNFRELKEYLQETKTRIGHVFDVTISVLEFLKANQGQWELKEGQIGFKTQGLYDQYNALVKQLKVEPKETSQG